MHGVNLSSRRRRALILFLPLTMIHLCTAALAFNARSAVLSNVPRAHVSMADKAVEPSIFALPAGLAGKVVPTGAKGPGPTVSTNLLKSSGLDDAAKVNVALDMYESAGVSIAPSRRAMSLLRASARLRRPPVRSPRTTSSSRRRRGPMR